MLRRGGIDVLDGWVYTRTVSSQRPFYEHRSSPIVDRRLSEIVSRKFVRFEFRAIPKSLRDTEVTNDWLITISDRNVVIVTKRIFSLIFDLADRSHSLTRLTKSTYILRKSSPFTVTSSLFCPCYPATVNRSLSGLDDWCFGERKGWGRRPKTPNTQWTCREDHCLSVFWKWIKIDAFVWFELLLPVQRCRYRQNHPRTREWTQKREARVPSIPSLPVVGSTVADTDAWTEYFLHPRVKDSNLMDIFYRCSTIICCKYKAIVFFLRFKLSLASKSSYMVSPRL